MLTRAEYQKVVRAFECAVEEYKRTHCKEKLIEEWDLYLWSKAARLLGNTDWSTFVHWFLYDDECIMETHMHDQMLLTIKRASPKAFQELGYA